MAVNPYISTIISTSINTYAFRTLLSRTSHLSDTIYITRLKKKITFVLELVKYGLHLRQTHGTQKGFWHDKINNKYMLIKVTREVKGITTHNSVNLLKHLILLVLFESNVCICAIFLINA